MSPTRGKGSYLAVQPPSMTIVWPVTYRPASLTSHNTAPTKSSDAPLIGERRVPAQPGVAPLAVIEFISHLAAEESRRDRIDPDGMGRPLRGQLLRQA